VDLILSGFLKFDDNFHGVEIDLEKDYSHLRFF
jgi:hypothetical protein